MKSFTGSVIGTWLCEIGYGDELLLNAHGILQQYNH